MVEKKIIFYNLCENSISNIQILKYLENLLLHLSNRLKISTEFIKVINGNNFLSDNLKFIYKVLNEKTLENSKIIDTEIMNDIWLEFEFFEQRKKKEDSEAFIFNSIIIIGDLFQLEFPYGLAVDGDISVNKTFTIISNVHEKSIWHEVSHMFGADDHYHIDTKLPKSICGNPQNCLMQYDPLKSNCFCDASIKEIEKTFQKILDA